MASLLAGEGSADLRMTDDLDVLSRHTLAEYAVVANYTSWMEPAAEQVRCSAQSNTAMSFLALHAASATFWNSPEYLSALGAKFVRRDPIKRFRVDIVDAGHLITEGVGSFEIEDELYELEGDLSTAHILASAENHQLLYTRNLGRVAW